MSIDFTVSIFYIYDTLYINNMSIDFIVSIFFKLYIDFIVSIFYI